MDNKINGRTPEEIKKGLLQCSEDADGCNCEGCPYDLGEFTCKCIPANQKDALAYIQHLEAERDQYRRERDAAERDLKSVVASNYFDGDYCKLCKYKEPDGQCYHHCIPYSHEWGWQWRGVQNDG